MLDKGRGNLYNGEKKEVHAMSLYDVVHAPQPRKRDRKLHILIAIGLILALAAVVMYQLVLRVEKILNRTWGVQS